MSAAGRRGAWAVVAACVQRDFEARRCDRPRVLWAGNDMRLIAHDWAGSGCGRSLTVIFLIVPGFSCIQSAKAAGPVMGCAVCPASGIAPANKNEDESVDFHELPSS